jgi:flagellar motility protein MotE (MotC chaperone)
MAMREKILQATEIRIDTKIDELKKLEIRIKGLLLDHDKESEQQIKSLVKVYENMKPKDAARIFEKLEMEILLDVTERMKEVKMAKVMAAMDPMKAKTLTVRLATRRRLPRTGG